MVKTGSLNTFFLFLLLFEGIVLHATGIKIRANGSWTNQLPVRHRHHHRGRRSRRRPPDAEPIGEVPDAAAEILRRPPLPSTAHLEAKARPRRRRRPCRRLPPSEEIWYPERRWSELGILSSRSLMLQRLVESLSDDGRFWCCCCLRRYLYCFYSFENIADRFVVLSYNILGVDNAAKHGELYIGVSSENLDWNKRKKLIRDEIRLYNPSILCLQASFMVKACILNHKLSRSDDYS